MNAITPVGLPIIHGQQRTEELAAWAARRIPHVESFGPCWACGVVRRRSLAAVVVFHTFDPLTGTVQVSMAADDPRWATRQTIGAILRIGFDRLGAPMRKVYAATPSTNKRAQGALERIGFTREGTLRHHYGPRVHGVCYGMMRDEFERRYAPTMRAI